MLPQRRRPLAPVRHRRNVATLAPPIEVAFPDLGRWAPATRGIPYVWTFAANQRRTARSRAGADARQRSLRRHRARLAARRGLPADARRAVDVLRQHRRVPDASTGPIRSGRVASTRISTACGRADVLDGPRQTADLRRARALRPLYDRVDYLLDLHSMTDRCPPLAMAGRQRKGVELAQALGIAGAHHRRRRARRRQAAARLRVLRRFRGSAQCAADRMRPALGSCRAGRGEAGDAAFPPPFRHVRSRVPRRSSRARAHAAAEGDRGHGDGARSPPTTSASSCRSTGSSSCRRPGRCSRATATPISRRPTTTAC